MYASHALAYGWQQPCARFVAAVLCSDERPSRNDLSSIFPQYAASVCYLEELLLMGDCPPAAEDTGRDCWLRWIFSKARPLLQEVKVNFQKK